MRILLKGTRTMIEWIDSLSDFFIHMRWWRTSYYTHKLYTKLDDLHWGMGSPIRCTRVKQDTEDTEDTEDDNGQ